MPAESPAVLVSFQKVVKLCDLGFVKITERHQGQTMAMKSVLGTPFYMAPELYDHKEDEEGNIIANYTKAVDIFSGGVLMHTLMNALPNKCLRPFLCKSCS